MKKEKKFRFQDFDFTAVEDIQCIQTEGDFIKVWVRDLVLGELYQQSTLSRKYKAKATALLKDSTGNEVKTREINLQQYLKLRKLIRRRLPVELLGKIVKDGSIKKDEFYNIVEIKKFRKGDSPLSMLQASKNELEKVSEFLSKIENDLNKGKEWALFEDIRLTVINEFNIIGTNVDDLYRDSIDAMICQAFSGGEVNRSNAKINTCVIGPPGAGKKLLELIAILLNVVSEEAQAIRVTPAGLTATMNKISSLGALPMANKGVFIIQDFDKSDKKAEILAIFSEVMEDGVCRVTGGTHKAGYDAETAIHIDINRFSDLHFSKRSSKRVTEDISLPTNIISRFDFIVDIQKNSSLQIQKAIDMIGSSDQNEEKSRIQKFASKNEIEVDRFLKLIVAYIMEEFEEIDISPVQDLIRKKFDDIYHANESQLDKMPNLAMFWPRLSNSICKFVQALTRLQLRSEPNESAVNIAFKLITRKLDFLRNIESELVIPWKMTTSEKFNKWIFDNYQDKPFSPNQVIKKYKKQKNPCGEVSVRTLRNYIEEVADKKKHNEWRLKGSVVKKFKS